jgi:predicted HicB family RNase H-like nuclease
VNSDKKQKTFPLRLPNSLRIDAVRTALEEGISLNQLISLAVAEKLMREEQILKENKGEPEKPI